MTEKDKIEKINSNTRFLAYRIFNHHGEPNYSKAYDKLWSTVYLQHGFNIGERLKEVGNEKLSMFDVIDSYELKNVLQSSVWLLNMYQEVLNKRIA